MRRMQFRFPLRLFLPHSLAFTLPHLFAFHSQKQKNANPFFPLRPFSSFLGPARFDMGVSNAKILLPRRGVGKARTSGAFTPIQSPTYECVKKIFRFYCSLSTVGLFILNYCYISGPFSPNSEPRGVH